MLFSLYEVIHVKFKCIFNMYLQICTLIAFVYIFRCFVHYTWCIHSMPGVEAAVGIMISLFFKATPSILASPSLNNQYCSHVLDDLISVDGQPLMTYLLCICRCLFALCLVYCACYHVIMMAATFSFCAFFHLGGDILSV